MNEEIKEILDKLKDSVTNPIDTEVDQFTQEAYDVPNYFCLDPTTNDCKALLDYITNLQEELEEEKRIEQKDLETIQKLEEENKRLKEYQEQQNNNMKDIFHNFAGMVTCRDRTLNVHEKLNKINKLKEEYGFDYKSRNEKAIEYITSEESINIFTSINAREKWLKINHRLLNILQGSDKE